MKKRLVAALLAATILPQPANAALIALYTFDDATDLGLDGSGAGNHATNFGADFSAGGYQGGAASFVSFDWMRAPVDVSRTTRPNLTWGAWAKPTAGGQSMQAVLSADNGGFDRQITIDHRGGANSWSTFTGNGVLGSGITPSSSDWTFLAAVYNQAQGNVTFYVNGQTFSAPTNFGPSLDYFAIGRNPSFSEFYGGLIDNVFVYDEALSADQVAQLRATGFPSANSAVPEPATWAMMIFGFGVVGGALRRSQPRRRVRFDLA